MADYIDGFILPIARIHLEEYTGVAEQVAKIWKEHGATEYIECIGEDLTVFGMRSFTEIMDLEDDEVVIFGWAVFPSKEVRDAAQKEVRQDPRMKEIVAPLMQSSKLIFDADKMVFGGFKAIVSA